MAPFYPKRVRCIISSEKVIQATSVALGEVIKINPPVLEVKIKCKVNSSGWTNLELRPWSYFVEPLDGIYDYDLVADAPAGVNAQVITDLESIKPLQVQMPIGYRGFKIHSSTNIIEVENLQADNVGESKSKSKENYGIGTIPVPILRSLVHPIWGLWHDLANLRILINNETQVDMLAQLSIVSASGEVFRKDGSICVKPIVHWEFDYYIFGQRKHVNKTWKFGEVCWNPLQPNCLHQTKTEDDIELEADYCFYPDIVTIHGTIKYKFRGAVVATASIACGIPY